MRWLLISLFIILPGQVWATTSTVNPNIPLPFEEIDADELREQFQAAYNDINVLFARAGLVTLSSNQILGSLTGGIPQGILVPSCPTGGLGWTSGSGFVCNSISGGPPSASANTVYAGPTSGGAGATAFRPLVGADLPAATSTTLGAVKPDNVTTTISNGVMTATSGAPPLSSVTAATTTNSIDNVGLAQKWNWSSLGSATGMAFGGTSTGSGTALSSTLTGSNTGYAGYFSNQSSSGFAGFFNGIVQIIGQFISTIQGSQLTNINVTLAPYNASGFRALTTISGTVTSGSTSIPVVSSAGFNTGQVVIIALAGTSGTNNFAGLISSIPDSTHIVISTTAVTGASLPPGATSGTTGTQNSISSTNFVYSFGSTTLASSASNGATTLALTNAATYLAGQGVLVSGGKTGGADLVTTITAVNGNNITISPGISNVSGVASGTNVQHDDTAAIQLAINQVSTTQNITIYFPDGVYQVNGPAQNTGTTNAAIVLPSFPYYTNSFAFFPPQVNLLLTGNQGVARTETYDDTGGAMSSWSGAVILSNISGYNVINGYTTGGIGNFTNIFLGIKNFIFRSYPNSNQITLNGVNVAIMQVDQVTIDDGRANRDTTPTNSGDWAIKTPAGANNGNNWITNTTIDNRYNAIEANEHTTLEHVITVANENGIVISNTGANDYGIVGRDVICNGNAHCLVVGASSNLANIYFTMLNIEHIGPVSSVDDISDPSNKLTGFVSTNSAPCCGGNVVPVINGAANLHVTRTQSPAYPFPAQVFSDLSNSHYSSAPDGDMVYCSDCTIASPCAGSGTGALAKHLSGAWVCN